MFPKEVIYLKFDNTIINFLLCLSRTNYIYKKYKEEINILKLFASSTNGELRKHEGHL